jgi:hypothetical protein
MAFFDEIAEGKGQVITFYSVGTGRMVKFPAFITKFSDDFTVSWGGGNIFGRVDPIKSYQSTGRRISASFDILGKDLETAKKNFANYAELIKMLYPVFSDVIGSDTLSRTIKAAPLIRIGYVNYIRSEVSDLGLLGCIQGVTFDPKFDAGHFISSSGALVPISYTMNLVFEPLNEAPVGSNEEGSFLAKNFPYGFDSSDISGNDGLG